MRFRRNLEREPFYPSKIYKAWTYTTSEHQSQKILIDYALSQKKIEVPVAERIRATC